VLNSKELLEKTGISRATLNNYIVWGIVPKPEVLPPGPNDGAAPRIGYYPDQTIRRIAEIQRLKKEGWTMKRIAEHFGSEQTSAPAPPERAAAQAPARNPAARAQPDPIRSNPADSIDRDQPVGKLPAVVLTHVAILASDLQHSSRIWSELPPQEYFELINQIWLTADPIFKRHYGSPGKHSADGIVCHFFPRPDSSYLWNVLAAALELQQAIRRVSKEWQLRKGWATELYMNTGISEGQEWLGSFKAASQLEFTALGSTINQASRMSEFATFGSVWATKNLVAKLTPSERQRLKYGIRRKNPDGQEVFVSSVFSKVDSLVDLTPGRNDKLKEIARLPIAEIVEITANEKRH
jgi:class 3 adenylate cyclase